MARMSQPTEALPPLREVLAEHERPVSDDGLRQARETLADRDNVRDLKARAALRARLRAA
jgi:hypothetical protein